MNIPILFIPSWSEVAIWRDDFALLDGDTARDWWNDTNDVTQELEYGDTY